MPEWMAVRSVGLIAFAGVGLFSPVAFCGPVKAAEQDKQIKKAPRQTNARG
jgi:hypothetical protein